MTSPSSTDASVGMTGGGAHVTDVTDSARETRGIGAVVGDLVSDLGRLIRQELQLARAELRESGQRAGRAGALTAVLAVAALLTLGFVSLALMWGLSEWMHVAWAALIVGILWGLVAALAATAAKKAWQEVDPVPHQSIETLKEDAPWSHRPTS